MNINNIHKIPTTSNSDMKNILNVNISQQNEIDLSLKESPFDAVFSNTVLVSFQSQLKDVLSQIDKQRDVLVKNLNMLELRKYKLLISEFISVLNSNLTGNEQIFFDSSGRQKVLRNTHLVDSKLKELTHEFMIENKNDVRIVDLIDSVKGLLIDTII